MLITLVGANNKVSANFTYAEIKCQCKNRCDGGHIRQEVLGLAEQIRAAVSEVLGVDCPHFVASGVRCKLWNTVKKGAADSQHLRGLAMDLYTPPLWLAKGRAASEWAAIAESVVGDKGGFGFYPEWHDRRGVLVGGVHIDARGHRARW